MNPKNGVETNGRAIALNWKGSSRSAGGLSFFELVGFPHVEGGLEFDREQGQGPGVREALSKRSSLKWALRHNREEPARVQVIPPWSQRRSG
jgi:hypothetical protein